MLKRTAPCVILLFGILFSLLGAAAQAGDLLSIAQEPALTPKPGTEQFRFIYSPTFYNPLIVRVTKTGDRITLRAIQFSGAGGYGAGHVMVDRTVAITPQVWERIKTLAEASRFWTLPTEDDEDGTDGSTWIIEGSRGDAQRRVSRWTPTYKTKERQLERFVLFGRYLISLSGLKIAIH